VSRASDFGEAAHHLLVFVKDHKALWDFGVTQLGNCSFRPSSSASFFFCSFLFVNSLGSRYHPGLKCWPLPFLPKGAGVALDALNTKALVITQCRPQVLRLSPGMGIAEPSSETVEMHLATSTVPGRAVALHRARFTLAVDAGWSTIILQFCTRPGQSRRSGHILRTTVQPRIGFFSSII
jgi:hypothetical protein